MTGLRVYAESLSDPDIIAERVRSHMPLVRKIAWQVHGRVRLEHVVRSLPVAFLVVHEN